MFGVDEEDSLVVGLSGIIGADGVLVVKDVLLLLNVHFIVDDVVDLPSVASAEKFEILEQAI